MALDGCGQLCKCILILVNILFAIVGLAMFTLGLWLRFSYKTRGFFDVDLDTQQFQIGVGVLIALGVVMLIAAIFGDYGACNENRTALGVFAAMLGILAGAQIVAGVLAFTGRYELGKQLADFYTTIYLKYANTHDPGLAVTLSIFHNGLQCCGVVGALDPMVGKTCPEMSGVYQTLTFPACPSVITDLFETKGPLVLGLFCGTAALLFFALACSSLLSKAIKRSRTSPPPYLILSSSTTTVGTPYPGQDPAFSYHRPTDQHPLTSYPYPTQHPLASYPYSDQDPLASYPYSDQNPVVLTPLPGALPV